MVVRIVVGPWVRVGNAAYANELTTDTGVRVHLTLEQLPTGQWDWTVWREGQPENSRYAVAPDLAAGFTAAEQAGRALIDGHS